jgi:raffinose/stachyose/melibiose transport system substrate-binding protein
MLRRFGIALAAGALALVAACAPGGTSDEGAATSKPTGEIETDPGKAGKTTLTVWDINTSGGGNDAMIALNKEFERKYPNITINRVSRTLNDTKTTLKLALSGDNPPDVVQANQGYPDMGAFVKAGLLLPLDSHAKIYGWDEKYPQQLLDLNTFSTDGLTWQDGSLYGVSQTGEIVGELPIQFGTADKSPAIHLFGVVQAAKAGKQAVRDLVTSTNGTWSDPPTRQAAQTIQDWAGKGYLPAGANGLSGDASAANFTKEQGVFRIDGTWRLAEFADAMGDNVGFMNPPPAEAGQPSVTQGGEGLAWSVTSKTENPDVAAAYIDFITDAHADDVLAETGNLPAVAPPSYQPEAGSLTADVFAEWREISENDGLVPFLDYATPTFYDTLTANLQQLLGGKLDAEGFTANLDADHDAFKKSR